MAAHIMIDTRAAHRAELHHAWGRHLPPCGRVNIAQHGHRSAGCGRDRRGWNRSAVRRSGAMGSSVDPWSGCGHLRGSRRSGGRSGLICPPRTRRSLGQRRLLDVAPLVEGALVELNISYPGPGSDDIQIAAARAMSRRLLGGGLTARDFATSRRLHGRRNLTCRIEGGDGRPLVPHRLLICSRFRGNLESVRPLFRSFSDVGLGITDS